MYPPCFPFSSSACQGFNVSFFGFFSPFSALTLVALAVVPAVVFALGARLVVVKSVAVGFGVEEDSDVDVDGVVVVAALDDLAFAPVAAATAVANERGAQTGTTVRGTTVRGSARERTKSERGTARRNIIVCICFWMGRSVVRAWWTDG